LGFWPSRFSLLYTLLISAFSLLIAFCSYFFILTEYFFHSTERSTTLRVLLFLFFLARPTTASVIFLASFIFDAIYLIQCVATRSLSGGCFQAYCLLVFDF